MIWIINDRICIPLSRLWMLLEQIISSTFFLTSSIQSCSHPKEHGHDGYLTLFKVRWFCEKIDYFYLYLVYQHMIAVLIRFSIVVCAKIIGRAIPNYLQQVLPSILDGKCHIWKQLLFSTIFFLCLLVVVLYSSHKCTFCILGHVTNTTCIFLGLADENESVCGLHLELVTYQWNIMLFHKLFSFVT